MQTPTATACLSGSLSGDLRSAAEVDPVTAQLVDYDIRSFDVEPEELLERIAAMLALAFVAATVIWLPRARRF